MAYLIPYAGAPRRSAPPKPRLIKLKPAKLPKPPKPPKERKPKAADCYVPLIDVIETPAEFGEINVPNMPKWIKQLMFELCLEHKVHPDDLVSHKRHKRLAVARREFCYRLNQEHHQTLSKIGRWINKDHTTVLYAVRAAAEEKSIPLAKGKCYWRRKTFSPRLIRAYWLFADGLHWIEVAEKMNINPKTARAYKSRIKWKLAHGCPPPIREVDCG